MVRNKIEEQLKPYLNSVRIQRVQEQFWNEMDEIEVVDAKVLSIKYDFNYKKIYVDFEITWLFKNKEPHKANATCEVDL